MVRDRAVEDGAVDYSRVTKDSAVSEDAAEVHEPKVLAGVLGYEHLDLQLTPPAERLYKCYSAERLIDALHRRGCVPAGPRQRRAWWLVAGNRAPSPASQ